MWGQTFTSNSNGNWTTAGIWTKSNHCGTPGQENDGNVNHNPSPPTGSYYPYCQIDVVINHDVVFDAGSQFGAGYFKSLTVSSAATLTFPLGFTTENAGSNVGGVVYNFSNNAQINVTGATTFTSNAQVNLSTGAELNSDSMIIDGGSDVIVDGNSSIDLTGDLTVRYSGQLQITGGSIVIVDNLYLEGDNAGIYVEEGSTLIVRNATSMPQGPNTIVVEGNFQTGSMDISGGSNHLTINGNGTVNINGDLTLDGDGRLDLNGDAGVVVEGTITISNSGGSGIDMEPDTNLIVLSPGSVFAPGKTPGGGGGCFQYPENPTPTECESDACLQTFLVSTSTTTKERVYIFKCSMTWTVPTDTISLTGDSLEIIDSFQTLVVAGGGGAGTGTYAGGGGAGGLIYEADAIFPHGDELTVSVGQGGIGASINTSRGGFGGDSFIEGKTAAKGGGGGGSDGAGARSGNGGGSGGGGAFGSGALGGSGTAGQGNDGATATTNTANPNGAGGGGAGTAGIQGSGSGATIVPGDGGAGLEYTISETSQYYAGGGGGYATKPGIAGLGAVSGDGANAAFNTGSGGSGGSIKGGNGGSGVIIIRTQVFRILPVEFLSFTATYRSKDKSALLEWATAKEWENSHFEIERAVGSVKTWETIGTLGGSGYSDTSVSYSYTDTDLPKSGGNVFYRIKQFDYSGKYSYTVTRAIQTPSLLDTEQSWLAYPNPSASGTNVHVELIRPELYQDQLIYITLSNLLGQAKSYSPSTPEDISLIVSSWLNSSAPGLYILDIAWGNHRQQIKLVRN